MRGIRSPRDKGELRSILGLFSWYAQRSNLRDSIKGMRDLVKSKTRFKWDDDLESDLRNCIEILLDPVSGCLRAPIDPTKRLHFCLFTDSSRHSHGGILSQFQEVSDIEIKRDGVNEGDRRLYLLEYFSKSIDASAMVQPICLLELQSLFVCLRHWEKIPFHRSNNCFLRT